LTIKSISNTKSTGPYRHPLIRCQFLRIAFLRAARQRLPFRKQQYIVVSIARQNIRFSKIRRLRYSIEDAENYPKDFSLMITFDFFRSVFGGPG